MMSQQLFSRYIGIDYSGAQTAEAGLQGLRVYVADRETPVTEVLPPAGSSRYWSRRGLAAWLIDQLDDSPSGKLPAIVGIDHGFSFPRQYFETYGLEADWGAFLDDFQHHWPTDEPGTSVDSIRRGERGHGAGRMGNSRWRRMTELGVGAKSVFHFDVPGSVAKSTHAGLPWLRQLRQQCVGQIHCWPFDGWEPEAGRSLVAEIYPSLWSRDHAPEGRTPDQHDAWVVATWLQQADLTGELRGCLQPALSDEERQIAGYEGWILGVR
jgi:hypothetical protein